MMHPLRPYLAALALTTAIGCGSSSPPPEEPLAEPAPPAAAPASTEPAIGEPESPAGAGTEAPAPPDATGGPAASAAPATTPEAPPAAPDAPAKPDASPQGEGPAGGAPGLPGANLNVESMNVDGLLVKHLSCKTAGGGLGALFGTLTIAAGLGKRKAQLDACGRGGTTESTVHWHQNAQRITKVEAKGADGKRNACVERALTGAPATTPAECVAVVAHGK